MNLKISEIILLILTYNRYRVDFTHQWRAVFRHRILYYIIFLWLNYFDGDSFKLEECESHDIVNVKL